ncbi:hypothetical protein SmJEL517_g04590 [Synchytrium microbalum]|uniref:SH3 domain-containing protein n=1 Tax=Synchytrium microbalum TaxID=1806994 RepID=A0A507BRF0_9FUNG|nr:uncharacterized protein SmJEL517_g04590 [Synchytrium microbalum]TPX32270.1 hypothetical protein SmJEL517_g04590 [Synchytrium microbalum]
METFKHKIGAIFRPRRPEAPKPTSAQTPFVTTIVVGGENPSISTTTPSSQQGNDINGQSEGGSSSSSSAISTAVNGEPTTEADLAEPPAYSANRQRVFQYQVTLAYTPREPDELLLNLGDIIIVNETFVDGWAHGYSQSADQYGMVPMAALEAVVGQTVAETQSSTARSSGITKEPISVASSSNSNPMDSSSQDLSTLKAWLTPTDFRLTTFTLKEKRLESTRGWLLDELTEWKDSVDQPRVYWLSGVAGVGKSVVAGSFADKLQQRNQLAAHFFCKFDEIARNDPLRVLATWAFQLASFDPDMKQVLKELHEAEPNFLINASSIGLQFNQLIAKPLSKYRGDKAVILLDALDECAVEGSKLRREFLQTLGRQFALLPKNISVFVTSRPIHDLRKQLSDYKPRMMTLEATENLNDIKLYATYRMNRLRHVLESAASVDSLADKLAAMAHGLFVWLYLACDEMDRSNDPSETIAELEERTLGNDEDRMDTIYSRALVSGFKGVPQSAIQLYTKLAGALVALRTPMSIDQMSSLLDIPSIPIKLNVARIESLLIMSKSSVQLMHKSVADFITSSTRCNGEASPFYIDRQLAESYIARMCLLALPSTLRLASIPGQIEPLRGIVAPATPTHISYALSHWADHLDGIQELDKELTTTLVGALQNYGSAMLIVAVLKNLPRAITHILKVGGGPSLLNAAEAVKFFKSTILVEAIVSDNEGIVEALLAYGGAPVNGKEGDNLTPMQACILSTSSNSLGVLCRYGVDLEGKTDVTEAYRSHNYDSVSTGAINLQVGLERARRRVKLEESHMDELMNAARLDNFGEFKQVLLANPSIDINQKYPECGNKTLLLVACQYGSIDIVTYLLSLAANPNLVDDQNRSPLHHACSFGSLDTVKALIMAGALVDAEGIDYRDAFWNTTCVRPIDLACEKGHIHIVRWLLDSGVSPSALGEGKVHPLGYAAIGDSVEVIQLLLSKGVDVDCMSKISGSSGTSLFGAAMLGAENSVAYLINVGADAERAAESEGMEADGIRTPNLTPLDIAWIRGYSNVVALLLPRYPPCRDRRVNLELSYMGVWLPYVLTPLIVGVVYNQPELIKVILEYGQDTEVVQPLGTSFEMFDATALLWAFWHGRTIIARMLLDAGANIKARVTSNRSCLHVVAISSFTGDRIKSDMIRLGKYYGADLDDRDADGCTPLHLAISNKALQTVETLLELGASVNIADNSGNTPLHEATKENAVNLVTLLVNKGADKSKANKSGMTALQIAEKAGYHSLVRLLK